MRGVEVRLGLRDRLKVILGRARMGRASVEHREADRASAPGSVARRPEPPAVTGEGLRMPTVAVYAPVATPIPGAVRVEVSRGLPAELPPGPLHLVAPDALDAAAYAEWLCAGGRADVSFEGVPCDP